MEFTIRGRRPGELDQLLEQTEYSFEFPREFFVDSLSHYPGLSFQDTRMGFLDNLLIASVLIFPIPIYVRRIPIMMGGIANVGTLPQFRRRGFIEKVLDNSIAYMRKSGCSISGLYTGVHDVYRPQGFETWKQPDVFLSLRKEKSFSSRKYQVVPFTQRDLPAVKKIYQDYSQTVTGPMIRSDEYWRVQFGWARFYPPSFYVAKNARGIIQGYARIAFNKTYSQGWVNEACGTKDDTELWKSLAQRIIQEYQSHGMGNRIYLVQNFLNHPLRKAFEEMGYHSIVKPNRGLMLRIINLPKLLTALIPVMEKNLGTQGINESFELICSLDKATLHITRGKIKISKKPSRKKITLPPLGLLEWIFGRSKLSKLPMIYEKTQFNNITEKDITLLDSLLPPQNWTYWRTDGF